MPFAKDALANYITETIRAVVRAEVLDPVKSAARVYREPRIFNNLLSSQPLCFNLFSELQRDLGLASRVFGSLLGQCELSVDAIEFEYSPGRGNPRFTSDGTAFDVFVSYTIQGRCKGFVGIEVKYAENLEVEGALMRPRYEEVADAMDVFIADARERLRRPPLEQFWRDHLLAGSLVLDVDSGFEHGAYAIVFPRGNTVVGAAVDAYRDCLRDHGVIRSWSLELVLDAIQQAGGGEWVLELRERYVSGGSASS